MIFELYETYKLNFKQALRCGNLFSKGQKLTDNRIKFANEVLNYLSGQGEPELS